jgi:hypothetical protein
MKELHPSIRMNSHIKAHSFFVNESGVFVPTVQPEITHINEGLKEFYQIAMEL